MWKPESYLRSGQAGPPQPGWSVTLPAPSSAKRHLKLPTFYSGKNGYNPAHFYIYLSPGDDKKKNREAGAASQPVVWSSSFQI